MFLDAKRKTWGLILLDGENGDCVKIGAEPKRLHRLPDKAIFVAPMVLVNQGCSRFAYCDFDVLFQHAIQSIAGPKTDEDLLLFLTALLNTPLTAYYTFHTAANLGVERDKVHFQELLQLPFPLPEQTKSPRASSEIVREAAARLRRARDEMLAAGLNDVNRNDTRQEAIREVTELVYRYYDLTRWERALVEDTVKIFRPSSTPATYTKAIPTVNEAGADDRETYAELLCQTVNRWAQRSRYFLTPSILVAWKKTSLCLADSRRQASQHASVASCGIRRRGRHDVFHSDSEGPCEIRCRSAMRRNAWLRARRKHSSRTLGGVQSNQSQTGSSLADKRWRIPTAPTGKQSSIPRHHEAPTARRSISDLPLASSSSLELIGGVCFALNQISHRSAPQKSVK